MTSQLQPPSTSIDQASTQWPITAHFLDAFARRDFVTLAACLSPDVRMRAVTPFRELDLNGPDEVAERFAMWFGDAAEFDVLDASIGGIGGRAALQWRVRTLGREGANPAEVVEQHVFATVTDRIEKLDLLCSGFQPYALDS